MKHIISYFIFSLLLLVQAGLSQQQAYRYRSGQDYYYWIQARADLEYLAVGEVRVNYYNEMNCFLKFSVTGDLADGSMEGRLSLYKTLMVFGSEFGSKTQILSNENSDAFRIDGSGRGPRPNSALSYSNLNPTVIWSQTKEFVPVLDGAKLKNGSSWEQSYIDTVTTGNSTEIFTNHVKYHVTGMENRSDMNCYKIECTRDTDIKGVIMDMGQSETLTAKQHLTGVIYHAAEEGLLVEMDMTGTRDQTLEYGPGMDVVTSAKIHSKVALQTK